MRNRTRYRHYTMNDPIFRRSVGLKQSRWLWLDALAQASGDATSELVRRAVESFLLNSVGPAERSPGMLTEQRDDNGVARAAIAGDSPEQPRSYRSAEAPIPESAAGSYDLAAPSPITETSR